MQPRQQLNEYLKQSVEGVAQGDLILILYEAGITCLNLAKRKILEQETEGAHNALVRATNVVRELMASLNMEKGGEIAQNLLRLYAYINRRIMESNARKETSGIDEALMLFSRLQETWREAVKVHQESNGALKRPDTPNPGSVSAPRDEASIKRINIRG